MKLNDAVLARPLIEKLAAKDTAPEDALPFADFVRQILTVIQEFEVKRAGWFEKYGEEAEEGGMKIKEENEKKFKTSINRALNKELDIEPFALSETNIEVSPAELLNVLPLFK